MRSYEFYVYIISNEDCTVLYIGMTNNLIVRINQHRAGEGSFFTKKYNCKRLLYFEKFNYVNQAMEREKELKKWNREWKENLIRTMNPEMKDLVHEL